MKLKIWHAIILAGFLILGGCDQTKHPEPPTDVIEYIEMSEESESPTEAPPLPENAVSAIHAELTVYINDTPISMTVYHIEGGYYFYLRDIAYVLKDTLASFSLSFAGPDAPISRWHPGGFIVDYGPPSDAFLHRGRPFEPRGIEMRHRPPGTETAAHVNFRIIDNNWLSRGGIAEYALLEAFIINARPYMSLWDMGLVLGYYTYWNAQSNTFYIDTQEPALSDYGRQVAEEFLRPFLTLHNEHIWQQLVVLDPDTGEEIEFGLPFYQDGRYVQRYDLLDLTGDGIPAIVLHWDVLDMSRWGAGQYLYVYQDGSYVQVAEIGTHIFFRSSHGNVFLYTDRELGKFVGAISLHSVMFGDGDPRLELLLSSEWDSESREYVFYISEELADMDEEAIRYFWRNAPVFSVPGRPDEPLFPVRPFTLAHLDD